MKLSDIKGERLFDLMPEIIRLVTAVAMNDSAAKLFKREKLPEGADRMQYALERLHKHLPELLRACKEEFIQFFALLENKSRDEYLQNLDFARFLQSAADLISDPMFKQLFISAQNQTGGASSGAAQESTGAV